MTSILITGSNRGIGLDLVRNFLEHKNPPKLLIATCRNPDSATALQSFAAKHANLRILLLELDDIDSYPIFVDKVSSLVGDAGLNVLINNAAIVVMKPWSDLEWQDYSKVFHTNTIAPICLTKALLPLIRKAATVNGHLPQSIHKAAVVNISTILGSTSLCFIPEGDLYHAYRESKAALNHSARTLARYVGSDGILVANLHPGWVRTDLGGYNATLSVEESSSALINVIYNLSRENHDSFMDWNGEILPW